MENSIYDYINKGNKILIFGAYGYGNVGTEAILAGILEKISKKTTVVSADPWATRKLHCVKTVAKASLWLEFAKSDTIVIGGDELINDKYFRTHEYSNNLWRLKKPLEGKSIYVASLLSRILQKRLVFLGIGVGEIGRLTRAMIKVLGGKITVRDNKSREQLLRLGLEPEIIPDPSKYMKKVNDIRKHLKSAGVNKRYVSITVKNGFTDINTMQQLCSYLKKNSIEPLLVQMAKHPYNAREQDMIAIRKIGNARVFSNPDPRVVEGVISKSLAVVGTRMHSIIFAAKNNVPAICIPYSQKHKHVLNELGLDATFVSDHKDILPAFKKCLEKRPA